MSIKQVKVSVADITMGMYVSCLDRPWSQTPFPIQGLLVKSPKEISALRNYCEYVYIDVTKGSSPAVTVQQPSKTGPRASPTLKASGLAATASPIDVKRGVYGKVVPLSEEVQYAEKGLMQLRGHFALAVKQIAKGRDFDYQGLKDSVGDMVNLSLIHI